MKLETKIWLKQNIVDSIKIGTQYIGVVAIAGFGIALLIYFIFMLGVGMEMIGIPLTYALTASGKGPDGNNIETPGDLGFTGFLVLGMIVGLFFLIRKGVPALRESWHSSWDQAKLQAYAQRKNTFKDTKPDQLDRYRSKYRP